jgi:hypothetical protein
MESGRAAAAGLSTRLRSQISRIDRFMAHTARDRQDPSLLPMGDSLLSSLPVNTDGDDVSSLRQQQSFSTNKSSPTRTSLRLERSYEPLHLHSANPSTSPLSYHRAQPSVLACRP